MPARPSSRSTTSSGPFFLFGARSGLQGWFARLGGAAVEVEVEAEAASRLGGYLAGLGRLVRPDLTWPGLARPRLAGWLGTPRSVSSRDIQRDHYHGTALQETVLASRGFSCTVVVPRSLPASHGTGRLGPHWEVDRSDCRWADGILRTKWHSCSTKCTFMCYTVQMVPGKARLCGTYRPAIRPPVVIMCRQLPAARSLLPAG